MGEKSILAAKVRIMFSSVRLFFSSAKNLSRGDILIDDRTANGAGEFTGRLIRFGSSEFPNWQSVLDELL